MQIESWQIGKVKPYANNPRVNDAAVAAVAASFCEFGFRQPIVVDVEGVIVCGHTRWKAAQHLGLDVVPVHVQKNSVLVTPRSGVRPWEPRRRTGGPGCAGR